MDMPSITSKTRWSKVLYLLITIGFILSALTGYLYTRTLLGADSAGCRLVYMLPSYARITGFDESHTKFASKYSIYLYREQDVDRSPEESNEGNYQLDGIPVLFIPGNAGSYRQVRSIASGTSNMYYEEYAEGHPDLNPKAKNLDYFAADFNEDFTAFHGRTILDQAEYLNEAIKFILDLYSVNENPPKSVIVVGHSMGGVVARVMLSLPNYFPDSVNTILTLASPHAAAPLTFDGDLLKIYSAVDRFWYEGYHKTADEHSVAYSRLANLSLISITGGLLDSTLPADYTTLGYLVPPTNGFTVYSTGIPQVWTPIDHLAIVWCGQLRQTMSKILMEILDFEDPHRTIPLAERMVVFRKNLLTGFEDYASQDLIAETNTKGDIRIKLDSKQIKSMAIGGEHAMKLQGKSKRGNPESKMNIFHLPKSGEGESYQFSLLSSVAPQIWNSEDPDFSVLLCRDIAEDEQDEEFDDFTTETTNEYVALSCVDVSGDSHIVPRSVNSLEYSSFGGESQPYHALRFNSKVLDKYEFLVVATQEHQQRGDDYFILGDISSTKSSQYEIGQDMFSLLTRGGAEISLPADRPLAVNINIPGAWSSILAYKLRVKYSKKIGGVAPFRSFIRQWIEDPYETKWHINIEDEPEIPITLHAIAPFVPFKHTHRGLNIELWSSGEAEASPLDIVLQIDILNSLRLLVLRYRLALVAGCVSIVLLVMKIQIGVYTSTGRYPNFVSAMGVLNSGNSLLAIIIVLTVLTPLMRSEYVQELMNLIDPVVLRDSNEINLSLHSDFKVNSFYLGLEEVWLWPIGVVFYLIGSFLVFTTYHVFVNTGLLLTLIIKVSARVIKPLLAQSVAIKNNPGYPNVVSQRVSSIWSGRRLIASVFLLAMIPLYAPYQFVYIVCFMVQAITLVKILLRNSSSGDVNLFNFQVSLFMLMAWVLPINVPILIVFVHNMTVNWKTPFSSHHNFLSIFPILLLVERNTRMQKLPRFTKGTTLMKWFVGYFVFYCLMYGIRHTFWIHHLFNVLCCFFLRIYYENEIDNEEKKEEELSQTAEKYS